MSLADDDTILKFAFGKRKSGVGARIFHRMDLVAYAIETNSNFVDLDPKAARFRNVLEAGNRDEGQVGAPMRPLRGSFMQRLIMPKVWETDHEGKDFVVRPVKVLEPYSKNPRERESASGSELYECCASAVGAANLGIPSAVTTQVSSSVIVTAWLQSIELGPDNRLSTTSLARETVFSNSSSSRISVA